MQSIRRWDQIVENKSQRIVRLVGSILNKKYPHFHETNEIPFDDLLEWELWPGCLKIYGIMCHVIELLMLCLFC